MKADMMCEVIGVSFYSVSSPGLSDQCLVGLHLEE